MKPASRIPASPKVTHLRRTLIRREIEEREARADVQASEQLDAWQRRLRAAEVERKASKQPYQLQPAALLILVALCFIAGVLIGCVVQAKFNQAVDIERSY